MTKEDKEGLKFDVTSFDAKVWAKEFMRIYNEKTLQKNHLWIDEELMIAWFANAIMAGYDNARWKKSEPLDEDVKEELERILSALVYDDKYLNGKKVRQTKEALLQHFEIRRKRK